MTSCRVYESAIVPFGAHAVWERIRALDFAAFLPSKCTRVVVSGGVADQGARLRSFALRARRRLRAAPPRGRWASLTHRGAARCSGLKP